MASRVCRKESRWSVFSWRARRRRPKLGEGASVLSLFMPVHLERKSATASYHCRNPIPSMVSGLVVTVGAIAAMS